MRTVLFGCLRKIDSARTPLSSFLLPIRHEYLRHETDVGRGSHGAGVECAVLLAELHKIDLIHGVPHVQT